MIIVSFHCASCYCFPVSVRAYRRLCPFDSPKIFGIRHLWPHLLGHTISLFLTLLRRLHETSHCLLHLRHQRLRLVLPRPIAVVELKHFFIHVFQLVVVFPNLLDLHISHLILCQFPIWMLLHCQSHHRIVILCDRVCNHWLLSSLVKDFLIELIIEARRIGEDVGLGVFVEEKHHFLLHFHR